MARRALLAGITVILAAGCLLGARINLGTPGGGAGGVGGASPGPVWTGPPIGIPDPGWGITTPVTPALPSSWTSAVAGFYYVDSGNPASTDTANGVEITDANTCRYGWPAVPRQTIPSNCGAGPVNLLAGSVVDLAPGKVYSINHTSPSAIIAAGTSANPVFIISSITNKAKPDCFWEVAGTYLIIEGLHFTVGCGGTNTDGGIDIEDQKTALGTGNSDHIAFRHNEHEGLNAANAATSAIIGNAVAPATTTTNVVIYDDLCHHNGVYQISVAIDDDHDCWTITEYANHIWALDSRWYTNSNDGVQVNPAVGSETTTHHIYVGRNTIHDMRENCLWAKAGVDIVFSQNTCYNIHYTVDGTGAGAGIGAQYGPDYLWVIFNKVYSSDYAIGFQSDNAGVNNHYFEVGNLLYNCQPGPYSIAWTTTNADTGFSGMQLRGGVTTREVNNTIYNCGNGIDSTNGTEPATHTAVNNLISNLGCYLSSCPSGSHIYWNPLAAGTASDVIRTLFDPTARIKWNNDADSGIYTPLSAWTAAFPGKGVGDIEGSAVFVNAAGGDFHEAAGSPSINAAGTTVDSAYTTFQTRYGISIQVDFDGVARPVGGAWDMGAYER